MNGYLASNVYKESGFRIAYKTTDINSPSASDTFVFVEERADTIDNDFFAVGSTGFMDSSDNALRWIEIPANYHAQSSNFSFADRHVASQKWQHPLPEAGNIFNNDGFPPDPNSPDIWWLFRHATRKR